MNNSPNDYIAKINSVIAKLNARRMACLTILNGNNKLGKWFVCKNVYYQYIDFECKGDYVDAANVVLERKGVKSLVDVNEFLQTYRPATVSEANQHVEYLASKNLKWVITSPQVIVKDIDTQNCEFYMVTCTGLHGSKVRHNSFGKAMIEAERVARDRNHEAWVVGVVASVKIVDAQPIKTIYKNK